MAYKLAHGRFKESPFPEEMLAEGRRRLLAIIGKGGEGFEERPAERQPFFLKTLAEVARVLGGPDWPILANGSNAFEMGVIVGYRRRLPRTPAAFESKYE